MLNKYFLPLSSQPLITPAIFTDEEKGLRIFSLSRIQKSHFGSQAESDHIIEANEKAMWSEQRIKRRPVCAENLKLCFVSSATPFPSFSFSPSSAVGSRERAKVGTWGRSCACFLH